MRKLLLSIYFSFLSIALLAQVEDEPYITVIEEKEKDLTGKSISQLIHRLIDVESLTTMTYYSEWRRKERLLYKEAKLLSIEPALPLKATEKNLAKRYDFKLVLDDVSFGEMTWKGFIQHDSNNLLMKMKNIDPIISLGFEAAPAQTIEIILDIEKTGSTLHVKSTGYAHYPIKVITKKRATESIRNRLLAFQKYILNF